MKSVTFAAFIFIALVYVSSSVRAQEIPGGTPGTPGIVLNAAGATSPYTVYSKWFNEFTKTHPDIRINYQSIGSGGGIRQIQAGTVDFGASDTPLNAEPFQAEILELPTMVGAVVPAYNIPGVNGDVKFTPDVLADIYLGKIMKWNDARIENTNPGVKFPDQTITVVHRSDGSGTTLIWTDYLSKVSAEWKSQVGSNTAVKWPVGLGGKGNEGVAGYVRQLPGSIGYVELAYALQNHMQFGTVKNAAGNFVKANLASTTAAAASTTIPVDFRASITNAPGKDAYPIASFTYLLIPRHFGDTRKKQAVATFLNWMLDHGQSMVEPLGYAPLPKELAEKERSLIKEIR